MKKLKRLRILAKIMLAASIAACVFGCWLIISGVHELAVLEQEGEAVRSATAPVITEIAEGVVLAVHYFFVSKFFIHSIKHGVPFTHEGAKEIRILGYETILLPVIAWIVSCIAYAGIKSPVMVLEISVYEMVLGFALIITSYVIEYGTDRIEQSHRGHQELKYIAEYHPEILKEARLEVFGTEDLYNSESVTH